MPWLTATIVLPRRDQALRLLRAQAARIGQAQVRAPDLLQARHVLLRRDHRDQEGAVLRRAARPPRPARDRRRRRAAGSSRRSASSRRAGGPSPGRKPRTDSGEGGAADAVAATARRNESVQGIRGAFSWDPRRTCASRPDKARTATYNWSRQHAERLQGVHHARERPRPGGGGRRRRAHSTRSSPRSWTTSSCRPSACCSAASTSATGSSTSPGTSPATLAQAEATGAAVLRYGLFINAIVNFLIVAFAIFLVLRSVRRFLPAPPAPDGRECPFCLSPIPLAGQALPALRIRRGAGLTGRARPADQARRPRRARASRPSSSPPRTRPSARGRPACDAPARETPRPRGGEWWRRWCSRSARCCGCTLASGRPSAFWQYSLMRLLAWCMSTSDTSSMRTSLRARISCATADHVGGRHLEDGAPVHHRDVVAAPELLGVGVGPVLEAGAGHVELVVFRAVRMQDRVDDARAAALPWRAGRRPLPRRRRGRSGGGSACSRPSRPRWAGRLRARACTPSWRPSTA